MSHACCHVTCMAADAFLPAARQSMLRHRKIKWGCSLFCAKQQLLAVSTLMREWLVAHLICVMVVVLDNAGRFCEGVLPACPVWPLCGYSLGSRYPPPHQVILLSCSSFSCAVLQTGHVEKTHCNQHNALQQFSAARYKRNALRMSSPWDCDEITCSRNALVWDHCKT